MRPSFEAAATRFFPLNGNTTGEEENSAPPAEKVCFSWRVLGSRATSWPPVVAEYTVPSGPKAGPAEPTMAPRSGRQELTCLDARSRAQIPLTAPLQL